MIKTTLFRVYPKIFDGRVIATFNEWYTEKISDTLQLRGAEIRVRAKKCTWSERLDNQ